MPSFCPHCGAEAPEEAHFCMSCGRERSPAPPPPETPPPPAYAPGPARPSAAGQFLGRALRGDWAGAAQAALWPVGVVLIAALALAVPSYGQDSDDVVVGFADRLRIALAVLLQGLGGSLEVSGGGSGGSPFGGGYDSGPSGSASVSVIPLLVTVVWIAALVIGVRMLRTRLYARIVPGSPGGAAGGSAGLEAAVRVALLVAGATLVPALFGQPGIEGVELSTAPFLTTLWTLLLALAVAGGVLHGDDLTYRVAQARPGLRLTVRAFGTAVRAMGWVLLVAAVLGWIGLAVFGGDGGSSPSELADSSDFDGSDAAALGVFLMLLPNLAVAVLGLCWGAPLEAEGRGSSSFGGGGYEKESFGLSRLGDQLGSGALVYALAVGLVCALVMGVLVARRSLDRREQLLAAGFFFGLFLLLAGVGGAGAEFAGDLDFFGSGSGRIEVGLSVPDALLFGLLWIGGAAFLAPYLLRLAGVATWVVPAPHPALPGAAPLPGAPALPGHAPTITLGTLPPPPDRAPTTPGPAGPIDQTPAAHHPDRADGQTPAAHHPDGEGGQAPGTFHPEAAPQAASVPVAYSPTEVSGPAATPGQPQDPAAPYPAAVTPEHAPYPYAPSAYTLTPAPEQPRRAGVWVATVVGALVIGGGAAAGVLLLQDDGDGTKGAGDARPGASRSGPQSPAGSQGPGPAPAATPTPTAPSAAPTGTPRVPAGYHQVFDEQGFSFAIPDAWYRVDVSNGSQTTYAGSTGMEKYVVGVIPNADYTSHENLLAMEKHLKEDKKKTGYRRIVLDTNTFQGIQGARWEYTYENEAGQTVHGIDQSYIAADGTEYTIFLTGKEDLWPDLAGTYQVGLDSWRLTDTE
ncbi:zinc-ribbon domain-containing protein [Streptomyces sp. NPDC006552]|uniref:zinc-ribbon domain-containing protein n=1 Tax=Streptomyces sp. NPDC006552 TaxID=3157179 RepID=UPI00339FB553